MTTTTHHASARLNALRHRHRATRTGSLPDLPTQPQTALIVQHGASTRWLFAVAATLLPGGLLALCGIAAIKRESARQDLNRAARRLHGRDPLTRLYDSTGFITQARRELVRTVDMQCPISLLLIDANDLAPIQRTHGVATVNRVLASIADICVSRLRGYDIIGRLDGQLIAVLLPGADAARAAAVMRTLDKRVSALSLDTPSAGVPLQVGIRVGIATRASNDENLGILIARARHALAATRRG